MKLNASVALGGHFFHYYYFTKVYGLCSRVTVTSVPLRGSRSVQSKMKRLESHESTLFLKEEDKEYFCLILKELEELVIK